MGPALVLGIGLLGGGAASGQGPVERVVFADRHRGPQPVLAGDALLWVSPAGTNGYRVRRLIGRHASTIFRASADKSRSGTLSASVFASSSAVVIQDAAVASGPGGAPDTVVDSRVIARVGAGAFSFDRPGCFAVPDCEGGVLADLDGTVALVPAPEGSPPFQARVRDLAQAGSDVVVADIGRVRSLAGDFVASTAGADRRTVVVTNWRTSRKVYRLSLPGDVAEVDAQSDGSIAFTYGVPGGRTGPRQQLAWASPASPFVHNLPASGYLNSLRLRAGRLIYVQRSSRPGGARAVIRMTDLASGRTRSLVHGVVSGADYDGTRVAWDRRTCSGVRFVIADLAALANRPGTAPRPCRLRLARPTRMTRRGELTLRPDCRGFAPRCTFDLQALRSARTYRRGKTVLRRGQPLARVDDQRNVPYATVRLGAKARSLVRRRPLKISVRIKFTGDSEGVVRRGTFTLAP